MIRRTFAFIKKEFTHILRDKRTMLILFAIPIILILLFGFAISIEVKNINFMVVAPEYKVNTNILIQKMDATNYFSFKGFSTNLNNADKKLMSGEIDAIVQLNKDDNISIILDASDPNKATIEANYLKSELMQLKTDNLPLNIIPRFLYNPQMRSSYTFVPGILGLILMLVCAMLTSVSIVREKETGTMEVLLVSPANPIMIIISKMIPYFVLSFINLLLIVFLSVYVLDMPTTGNFMGLMIISCEYIALALSIGLLISTIMKTQVTAMLVSGLVFLFPIFFLSGMLYPIENMPLPLQWISLFVPARWYIAGVKKLMIQGLDFTYVTNEFFIMLFMIIIVGFISYKNFKTKLE